MSNLAINTDKAMDFNSLLASYTPATAEQIAGHTQLENLAQMLGQDKLIYIHDNIEIINPETGQPIQLHTAGKYVETANSIAVTLYDETFIPSNLVFYPLDSNRGKPFLLHNDGRISGFIIGDGEVIACPDLDNLIELYSSLIVSENTDTPTHTLIAPFEKWQFDSMVKAFAKGRQVTIFTDYAILDKQTKTFKRDNVRLVATVLPIDELLLQMNIAGVLSDPDTRIDNLGGFEWGTPEPLADDKSKSTPYPIQAFTGVLREAVEAIAYHAQVPPAMAGQCVLGALSTIGQRYINAPMGHEHKPASLYLITEGESGSGKTQANKLSHYSINQWERNAYNQFIQHLKDWEADRNALKGAERLHYEATTPKPKNETAVITDATIEAVLDRFILDDIKNQSWTTNEAGQFLNGHSMKSDTVGNALSSLTSLWSGDPVSRLRSQRGKNATAQTSAYEVRLTLDIMGQRVILEPALTDTMMNGQGFLPRCLIACPDSLIGSREWNTPKRMNQSPHDDPRLQAYWGRCDILLDPVPDTIPTNSEGNPTRINMPFENAQARQVLADFQQDIEGRQASGRALEYLKAYASRMAENASRIASLMAFFDCQKAVSVDYLQRAFMLVEYSTAERLRYVDINPQEKNDSQKLIDWLIKQCKSQGISKIGYAETQSKVNPKHLRKKADFELLTEILTAKHYLRVIQQDNSRLIEINPCLLK